MTDTHICGIDIGSSKIATVVAIQAKDTDEIRIIGFNTTASRGVKKGLIVDIDEVSAAIDESVDKAERMAGHKINRAYVSVGGPHISSLNSHGVVAVSNPQGEIVGADVERVIDAARAISLSTTRQIIEVSPREYSVDGQSGIKNAIGMSGVRLEVDTHIITASSTNLKNIDRCLSDLGIENAGFVFSGLAASEAVLTETEKDLGVAVVDIGGGKTDICIYVDGALSYSASIPIGAKHISNDIAVGLRVSLQSADKIKLFLSKKVSVFTDIHHKKGEAIALSELQIPEALPDVTAKNILEGIIWPRLEEIYRCIEDEIEKSGFEKQIPSGLIITGGGALTAGMIEAGKRMVGLPIRIGVPDKVTGLVDEILDPQYASTIGLILCSKSHIMDDQGSSMKFTRLFKDFSFDFSFGKIKSMFKQFMP
ncbi:cell division protein FtsA [Candidatus Roizmanbacteria bacterium]|nr:cell division protein FtsA [Candidatus Roizmanbacteria bacterium]